MTHRLILALLAAAVAVARPPTTAQAATLGELMATDDRHCFVAAFDSKHLARHRKQKVTAVRLSTKAEHTAEQAREMIMFELAVSLRGSKRRLEAVGLNCFKGAGDTWSCQEATCNGRAIGLAVEGEGLVLDLMQRREGNPTQPGGLTLRSACGAPEVEKQTWLTLGVADQMFRLKRAEAAACR
jgi:hypothetical protein